MEIKRCTIGVIKGENYSISKKCYIRVPLISSLRQISNLKVTIVYQCVLHIARVVNVMYSLFVFWTSRMTIATRTS